MGKIHIGDLASVLVKKHQIDKRKAQLFISSMVSVIRDGLDADRIVKVKGLGTFKVVDVEARESVNVNTGERLIIESHSKLAFLPDATMKELVNRPFSLFESVLLNDGVDFTDMQTITLEEGEEVGQTETNALMDTFEAEEEVQEEDAQDEEEVLEDDSQEEDVQDEEEVLEDDSQEEDFLSEEEAVPDDDEQDMLEVLESAETEEPEEEEEHSGQEAPIEDKELSESEESSESEVLPEVEEISEAEAQIEEPLEPSESVEHEEPLEQEEPSEPLEQDESSEQEDPEEPEDSIDSDDDDVQLMEDDNEEDEEEEDEEESSRHRWWLWLLLALVLAGGAAAYLLLGRHSGQTIEPAEVRSADTVQTADIQSADSALAVVPDTVGVSPQPAADVEHDWLYYDTLDIRINTGAYAIVGLDHIIQVKEGDTSKRIALREAGSTQFACYIETYNGITADTLEAGTELRIPKLVNKRTLKSQQNNNE